MKKRTFIGLTLLLIVMTSIFSFYQVKPRKTTQEQKSSEPFQNTMHIVATIAQQIHPSSSAANVNVRDYLVKEIEALGLKADVMPFAIHLPQRIATIEDKMAKDPSYQAAMTKSMQAKGYDNVADFVRGKFGNPQTDTVTLYNILAKLDAPNADDGIMLVSHYDSVATGPGAADDGIAVASMLNYLQQAAKQNDRKNAIYFLFTDGEEQGLLGAHAYVENSIEKAKANMKAVFNFEARGNRGGLFMFESSKDNYDLVRHLNKAVRQPIPFSIATAIYEVMPNDTDFSVFKQARYDGLNFAMVEGFEHYHAITDTVENLDQDTAYQYMQTVSGIGDYFGKLDLSLLAKSQKGIFFPFLGLTTIVLPEMVGYILGCTPFVLAALLFYKNKKGQAMAMVPASALLRVLLGCAVIELTRRVLPASYIVSIPLTLFFLVDVALAYNSEFKRADLYGAITFLFAVFVLLVLGIPFVYLVQITLQNWYLTTICALLPTVLIAIYFGRFLQFYKQIALAENLA